MGSQVLAGLGVKLINIPPGVNVMHPIELIPALRETEEYKKWREGSPNAKLVHLFLILDPGKDISFDIGFFDFDKKLMTSFIVDEELSKVELSETKEVFAKDLSNIKPLDEEKIKVNYQDAVKTANELQKKEYSQHFPMKEVVVLQKLDIGQVWNITYITKTFQTLNIKIDSESGEVLEHKLHQIFSFDDGGKEQK